MSDEGSLVKGPYERSLGTLAVQQSLGMTKFLPIYLTVPRTVLWPRLEKRCQRMLKEEMIEETEELLRRHIPKTAPAFQSVGYPDVIEFLEGDIEREELEKRLIIATRQYAKRQETWFRKQNYQRVACSG